MALRLADAISMAPEVVDEHFYARLREHFSDDEILDLGMSIAFFSRLAALHRGLQDRPRPLERGRPAALQRPRPARDTVPDAGAAEEAAYPMTIDTAPAPLEPAPTSTRSTSTRSRST